jgi:hypothetical protein
VKRQATPPLNGYPIKIVRDFLRNGEVSLAWAERFGAKWRNRLKIDADFVETLIEQGLVVRSADVLAVTEKVRISGTQIRSHE